MKVEGFWCAPEEFTLGVFLAFGEDDDLGKVHITTIGIGILAVDFVVPINN